MKRDERTPLEVRFWAKVDRRGDDECWPWLACVDDHGYGVINAGGKYGRSCKAHRISALLAGIDIRGVVIRHTCDNPICVNPRHLLAGTQADNIADMHRRGRSGAIGELHHYAKLTEAKVIEIRLSPLSNKRAALLYGVCESNISAIRRRISWKQVA